MRLAVVLGALAAPTGLQGQTVAEVQVTPETMTIGVGAKQAIFAAAYDRQGNLIPAAKFTFWSSDTSIVHVSKDGTAVGVRPGLAKVEARVQRRRASLAVLVTGPDASNDRPPPGAALTLEPVALVLLPGETGHLSPHAVKDDGSALSIGRVTWKSLAPAIATVDSAGTVTGVAAGRGIMQATTSTGLMATAPVEVTAAEFVVAPSQLVLTLEDVDTLQARVPTQGNRRLSAAVRWRSLDSAVVRVASDGVVRGVAPGKTEVVAEGLGQERSVAVVVHKVPEAVVVSPRRSERVLVPRNGIRKFSAVAEAADSTPIPEIRATWALKDTATTAFDTVSGTLTAKAVGKTTVTATVPGFNPIVWTVEVIPGFVRLSRDRVGLLPGSRTSIGATFVDDAGRAVAETSALRWVSERPDIATVDADGTVYGIMPGRASIVAAAPWGQSDTVTVFVTGDLLVTSNRGGALGVYAVVRTKLDTLLPVLADRAANIDGVYSPDRTRVAFSSDRAGGYDLYIADADGANPRRITAGQGKKTAPVWTPDGTHLLYTLADSTRPAAVRVQIVDTSGGTPRDLAADFGASASPAASPDRATIALVGVGNKDKNPDLYLAPAAGGEPRRVTAGSERELFPQFFPDGDLLYAVERGRGKSARVMRQSPASDRGVKLFDTEQPLAALALSRDGAVIAYAVGKTIDPAKGRVKFNLYLRPTTPDGATTPVSLRPDEQIFSLAF